MASPINTLIATGGGYKPPMDISTARRNALLNEGLQQENTLRQQQIEANPAQRALNEKEMGIRSTMLDIRSKIVDLKEKAAGKDITMEYPGFSISGNAEDVSNVAGIIAQFPDQVEDPNFMPWMAKQGVTMKRTEQKPYKPMTREQLMKDKEEEAGIAAKYKKGMRVYDSTGNLILDTTGGGAGVTKPTQTAIEKDVLGLVEQLSNLKTLKNDFKRDYLTHWGAGKKAILSQMSKLDIPLSDKSKDFLAGRRRFIEGVEQVFNAYRKEITGAQAAMREISMLRDSILNKKMSPDEFEASFNRYIAQIERALRIKRMFARTGLQGVDLGRKIDELFMSGGDVPESEIDIRGDEIAAELSQRGIAGDELQSMVLEQLKSEGYH